MNLVFAFIPYFSVSLVVIFGLRLISIMKWVWCPAPYYIRIPVGLLWPAWILLTLIYIILGKMKIDIE